MLRLYNLQPPTSNLQPQFRCDPFRGVPVAVRIPRAGHGRIRLRVVQQPVRLAHDASGIGAGQSRGARGQRLRPLGRFAQHEHRLV